MAAKKPAPKKPKPVDQLTKPELLALVKRLHKRIERLEDASTARNTLLRDPEPKPDAQFIADVDEGARLALHGELTPAAYVEDSSMIGPDDDAPEFPWEEK